MISSQKGNPLIQKNPLFSLRCFLLLFTPFLGLVLAQDNLIQMLQEKQKWRQQINQGRIEFKKMAEDAQKERFIIIFKALEMCQDTQTTDISQVLNNFGLELNKVIPALTCALEEKNEYFRNSGIEALSQLGKHSWILLPVLIQSLYPRGKTNFLYSIKFVEEENTASKTEFRFTIALTIGEILVDSILPLQSALSQQNSKIDFVAVEAIEEMFQILPRIRHLHQQAKHSKNSSLKERAIQINQALNVGSNKDLAELMLSLTSLMENPDLKIRLKVVTILGNIGSTIPAEIVIALANCSSDPAPLIREKVATSLGRIGQNSIEAIFALINLLEDSEPNVRGKAATSLGYTAKDSTVAVKALVKLLKDPSEKVKIQTTTALGNLGYYMNEESRMLVLTPLLSLLAKSKPKLQVSALRTLGNIGSKMNPSPQNLIMVVVSYFKDKNLQVQEEAIRSFGRFVNFAGPISQEVATTICEMLAHKNSRIKETIANTLSYLTRNLNQIPENLVAAIIGTLTEENQRVRQAAARSCGNIYFQVNPPQQEKIFQGLIEGLKDKEFQVQQKMVIAFQQIGFQAKPAFGPLLKMLERDIREEVRQEIFKTLSHIEDNPDVLVAMLQKRLTIEKGLALIQVLIELRKIAPQTKEILPLLISLLKNKNMRCRHMAATELGNIGKAAKEATSSLEEALSDENMAVVYAARRALMQITGKEYK